MRRLILFFVALFATTTIFAAKQTVTLVIEQMECGNCQAKVEKVLAYEKGVRDLAFDLEHRVATVTFDDAKTDIKTLQRALLKQLKYKSRILTESEPLPEFHSDDEHDDHDHD